MHFLTRGLKNVNKFPVSANLSYYPRTSTEKICFAVKLLKIQSEEEKKKKERESKRRKF